MFHARPDDGANTNRRVIHTHQRRHQLHLRWDNEAGTSTLQETRYSDTAEPRREDETCTCNEYQTNRDQMRGHTALSLPSDFEHKVFKSKRGRTRKTQEQGTSTYPAWSPQRRSTSEASRTLRPVDVFHTGAVAHSDALLAAWTPKKVNSTDT